MTMTLSGFDSLTRGEHKNGEVAFEEFTNKAHRGTGLVFWYQNLAELKISLANLIKQKQNKSYESSRVYSH